MKEIVRFWNRLIQQFQYWNAVATFIPHFRFWLVTSSLRSLNLPLSQFLVPLDFNFNRYSYLLVANKKSSTCCSKWSKMVFVFLRLLLLTFSTLPLLNNGRRMSNFWKISSAIMTDVITVGCFCAHQLLNQWTYVFW
jgi:hypothetical protein